MNGRIVDPSAPTKEEVIAHNMKIAKANLACDLVKFMAGNAGFFTPEGPVLTPQAMVNFATGVAEGIIDTFSLMPDAVGNRGGLVS